MTNTQLQFPARASDPETSKMAARKPRENQRLRVLSSYRGGFALTDGEAGDLAGVNGAWKRCSELRKLGLIEPVGKTWIVANGAWARTCVITEAGKAAFRG